MTTQTYKEVVSQFPEWGRMAQAPFTLVIQTDEASGDRYPEVQTSYKLVVWRSSVMFRGANAEAAAREAGERARRKRIIGRAIHF